MTLRTLASVAIVASAALASADLIDKQPDLGNFWNPLGHAGTAVYADSFIVAGPGTLATALGTWLDPVGTPGDNVRFEILADTGGNLPNGAAVLGMTAAMNPTAAGLNLYTANLIAPVALVVGQRYWFAASVVGLNNLGGHYQVGGHTQNSGGINDNGTFCYSNDPNGINFDGRNLTPEMAFQVHLSSVPEPASFAVLGLGAVALLRRRRK